MLRFALPSIAVVASVASASCTEDCNTVEPVYAGEATDEAWLEMLDARADATGGGDAATFTAPGAGATVPASTSPSFAWDSPLKLARASTPSTPGAGPWRRRVPSLFDRVVGVVLPVAHAHLPPITSDVYLLEVDVPGRTCPAAALTTELSFTFDEPGWSAIAAGGGERTARLLSAFLNENNVAEGPFLAAPLTFTVDE